MRDSPLRFLLFRCICLRTARLGSYLQVPWAMEVGASLGARATGGTEHAFAGTAWFPL